MASPAEGQPVQKWDARVATRVYEIQVPVITGSMRLFDKTFYPAMAVGIVGVGIVGDVRTLDNVYRLVAGQLAAAALTVSLKLGVRRERPYRVLPGVRARTSHFSFDRYAFPSGHAALAFATATSWTLLHSTVPVAVVGYLWATGVSASRVWMGVHYPGDVLAGAILGTLVAIGVHALFP